MNERKKKDQNSINSKNKNKKILRNSSSNSKKQSQSSESVKSQSNASSYHIRPTVKNINVLTIKEKIVVSCDFDVGKSRFNKKQTRRITSLKLNNKEADTIKLLLKKIESCSGFKKYKYTFLVACTIIGGVGGILWFIYIIPVICLVLLVILCINYNNLRNLLIEGIRKDMALL